MASVATTALPRAAASSAKSLPQGESSCAGARSTASGSGPVSCQVGTSLVCSSETRDGTGAAASLAITSRLGKLVCSVVTLPALPACAPGACPGGAHARRRAAGKSALIRRGEGMGDV